VLEVHVQPGASRTGVAGLHGERLKLRIAARAVDGAANAALVEFLAGHFGVAKREVTILAGARARAKRVAVSGARREPGTLLTEAAA
jgi:uncharacterized protein (TIGR00251 family)